MCVLHTHPTSDLQEHHRGIDFPDHSNVHGEKETLTLRWRNGLCLDAFVWSEFIAEPSFGLEWLAAILLLIPFETVTISFLLYFSTFSICNCLCLLKKQWWVSWPWHSIVSCFHHWAKPWFTATQSPWLTSALANSDLLPRNWNFFIFSPSYLLASSPPSSTDSPHLPSQPNLIAEIIRFTFLFYCFPFKFCP